jgi:HlyD family type I secretion membrane fusion protein
MANDLTPRGESSLPQVYTTPVEAVPPAPPLGGELKSNARIGILVVILFFVVGGVWAANAPLSGAAIAPGIVSPEGSRQVVQHLEGGIIREFRVKAGDTVKAGDVLVVLDDIGALADAGQLTTRLRALAAQEARLRAERDDTATIDFNHPALADRGDPEVQDAIDREISQFQSRKENDETRIAILGQRVAQLQQQIVGTERQLVGVRQQRDYIREELEAVQTLFEKGYERKPRLLELKRTEAGLTAREGELTAELARSQESIGETEFQITNIRVERLEDVDKELARVQTERLEAEKAIAESMDILARTEVTAPVSGTVFDLRLKTPGGVVRPGDPILDIVPSEDALIINAKVSPHDIDDVHAGLPAKVTFPSYPQRTMNRIPATVESLSPDAFQDERTGEYYYRAKILVNVNDLVRLAPYVTLQAGLPAEVFIETVDRTLLDYLLDPIFRVLDRSMREPD